MINIEIIREDGLKFSLPNDEWTIPADGIDGIDAPSITHYTQDNADGQGITYTGTQAKGKDVTLKGYSRNSLNNATLRREAMRFFNPNYNFKVFVTYLNDTKWAEFKISLFSCPSQNINKQVEFTARLTRENPYWRSVDEFGQNIAGIEALWGWPRSFPAVGLAWSTYKFAKEVDITNDGDVDTYMRIIVKADAEVLNPKIINGPNFVRIIDTLQKGDEYELDFVNNKIYKNGQNAIGKMDRVSQFTAMGLEPGINTIAYDAEIGSNAMSVTVFYNQLYLGV